MLNADANAPGRLAFSLRLGPVAATMTAVHGADGGWTLAGELCSEAAGPIELARFHYVQGNLAQDDNLLALTESRLFRRGEPVVPHRECLEKIWASMHVAWPRLADPIHDQADWAVATDVAVLLGAWNAPGLVVGFTGPGTAFGEIGLHTTGEKTFYIGVRLDNILLNPGERRTLERARLSWGDWQAGLRQWAAQCAREMGARPVRAPLVGWCSWYQHYSGVRPEHVQQAAREFAAWPTPPGGRLIQIDDGFQVMPGDWRPNERFREAWTTLPQEIAASGSLPGLWLAPTTLFHRHPIVTEHPEWLQRLPDGQPAVSFSNWGWCDGDDYRWGDTRSPTYYLDPDHPGAQAFMAEIVREAVRAGWRYLKLDFTYGLSTARQAVNRSRTSMETLRELYRLCREAAGPDTIICACIGEMGRYALGHADTARLGGDIGGDWATLGRNLMEFLPRLCTNGRWWNGDPDVFYMRSANSSLSPEESWVLTGTIGLIGGVFLTSDFAGQWDEEAVRRVRHFWNSTGPHLPESQQGVYTAAGVVEALRVTAADGTHRVALYNWADEPRTLRVSLAALGLSESVHVLGSFPEAPPVRVSDGMFVCENQPAHSLRMVECRHLPSFRYQGVVLDPAGLRYSPHPDIIHPSVIATGLGWEKPMAKYYMYYAPHDAPGGICLALADHPEGPWREYPHNPVIGHEWSPHYQVSHVCSPHAIWNPDEGRLFLYFHGENDTSRYSISRDGVHFEYGGIAVTTQSFGPDLTEASYARVFRLQRDVGKGRYWMLLMGTLEGTRSVWQAWSADGRRWEALPTPLITPPPGTNQMGPGWLFSWEGQDYLIAFANRDDTPLYEPISDLYLYAVRPDYSGVDFCGLLMDHTEAGPDNFRINDPCLLQTPERWYLFVNMGRRLRQSIALAVADIDPNREIHDGTTPEQATKRNL